MTVREAFADRGYRPDGTLVPRGEPGALLKDPSLVTERMIRLVSDRTLAAVDGTLIKIEADSICVHGDSPGAVAMARAVHAGLTDAGVPITAFAGGVDDAADRRYRFAAVARVPAVLREDFRHGLVRPTAGLAPGFAQANLIAVPRDWAWDMLLYAQRNPKPCPVLDVSDPGEPVTALAPGADLRTDLPLYRVWRDGVLVEEVPDATAAWRDDLVAFLIGCSFSFEASLLAAGIDVRHISAGGNVPMYRTARPAVRREGCAANWSCRCGRCRRDGLPTR